jgi:hypothetical protein
MTALAKPMREVGAAILTRSVSTDSLIAALESIHDLDLGIGVPITFGPSDHDGSHKVWGTALDKSGQYQILDLD